MQWSSGTILHPSIRLSERTSKPVTFQKIQNHKQLATWLISSQGSPRKNRKMDSKDFHNRCYQERKSQITDDFLLKYKSNMIAAYLNTNFPFPIHTQFIVGYSDANSINSSRLMMMRISSCFSFDSHPHSIVDIFNQRGPSQFTSQYLKYHFKTRSMQKPGNLTRKKYILLFFLWINIFIQKVPLYQDGKRPSTTQSYNISTYIPHIPH